MKQPSNLPPGVSVKDIEDWQDAGQEQEHTPGPWAMSKDAVPGWYVQVTVYAESDGRRIATVFDREANACLIVSAPELLKALVKLSNEVLGSLSLVEAELRREIGNTNYTVLIQRATEARELVARVKGKQE